MLQRTAFNVLANLALLSLFLSVDVKAEEYFGSFHGELIVKARDGGRNLELTHPFSFVDSEGKHWPVPVGTVVDGASIPQAFWSIIGGPFEDKYREASVVHDHYCDQKTDSWENVHLVFYKGMRARGVGAIKAKLMYSAVYAFGPRWVEITPGNANELIAGQPILLSDAKDAIAKFIMDRDPSIFEINEIVDRLTKISTIEQLEKVLYENANCTPILIDGNAAPSPSRTLVLCGLSVASKRQAALKNLRALQATLRQLLHSNQSFLVPLMQKYVMSEDPSDWENAKEWSRNVYGLVKLGMRSALDVDVLGTHDTAFSIENVFSLLSSRAVMISPILSGRQKTRREMVDWINDYLVLVRRLETEVTKLETHLTNLSQ